MGGGDRRLGCGKGDDESGTAAVVCRHGHAAVVGDDNLLDERQAETRPLCLGREERPEDAIEDESGTPGPLSLTLMRCTPCTRSRWPSTTICGTIRANRRLRTRCGRDC